MKNILLFGAGKSAYSLIKYILEHLETENWHLTIADMNPQFVNNLFQHNRLKVVEFDLSKEDLQKELINKADIVISMLPATFHVQIAKTCLTYAKNLITPSYVSEEMKALNTEAKNKGLIFLNEMGLDPGIDHMSAKYLIDKIKEQGGIIEGF
ncbi:MAG: saccharopine dehydrogenase NADP-binding domain-containing protein, partial [Bacteroidetes bacterium]|nr:saccharopine dehydrogenase NADP-binding domain-containing protein [Bacteroidota bacterium]